MTQPKGETLKTWSAKDDELPMNLLSDDESKAEYPPLHTTKSDAERILDLEEKAKRLDDIAAKNGLKRQEDGHDPSSPKNTREKARQQQTEELMEGCTECCGDCCVGCECVIS
jgi:hypothetical protein